MTILVTGPHHSGWLSKLTLSISLGDDYAEVREPDRQVLGRPILPREVALEERIGEGQFGDVHKGILYPGVSGRGVWLL